MKTAFDSVLGRQYSGGQIIVISGTNFEEVAECTNYAEIVKGIEEVKEPKKVNAQGQLAYNKLPNDEEKARWNGVAVAWRKRHTPLPPPEPIEGGSAPATPEHKPIIAIEDTAEAGSGLTEAGDQGVVQSMLKQIQESNNQPKIDEYLDEKQAELVAQEAERRRQEEEEKAAKELEARKKNVNELEDKVKQQELKTQKCLAEAEQRRQEEERRVAERKEREARELEEKEKARARKRAERHAQRTRQKSGPITDDTSSGESNAPPSLPDKVASFWRKLTMAGKVHKKSIIDACVQFMVKKRCFG